MESSTASKLWWEINPLQILKRSHFIAGAEFGELEGNLLVNVRALYGLRPSGAR